MKHKIKAGDSKDAPAIHQYYLSIINCMPGIVYWVDINCKLKGYNHRFVELLGIKGVKDFVGTPYEQMTKFTNWSEACIEAFRLDDMAVLFSGEPKYNIEEPPVYNEKGEVSYYLANRVPLFDKNKRVIELVVVLTDITARKKAEESLRALQQPNGGVAVLPPEEVLNVLMVEDNLIAQKEVETILKALNCQVNIAASGGEALLLFVPGKYDIVFMDIGLQDISGFKVAQKFREIEKNTEHHVPIIALTSYQADKTKQGKMENFMDGELLKPFSCEQAKKIIRRCIYHEDKSSDPLDF